MKRDSYHEEKYRGCTIRLERDDNAESSREFDNVGVAVCWHRRYNLGDEQPKETPDEYLDNLARGCVKSSYPEALLATNREAILEKHYVRLPLYLYDHSGISISTGKFSCAWDSGQVGFIYCSLKRAAAEASLRRSPKTKPSWDSPCGWGGEYVGGKRVGGEIITLRQWAEKMLEGEVETYDAFLTGDVVGFVAEDPDGETIDSCWGFYPDQGDYSKRWDYPIGEAKSAIDRWHDEQDKEKTESAYWAARDVVTT